MKEMNEISLEENNSTLDSQVKDSLGQYLLNYIKYKIFCRN